VPQLFDQPVPRDRPAARDEQEREQGTLALAAERDDGSVAPCLHWTEDAKSEPGRLARHD
jgi:hypothetical protein